MKNKNRWLSFCFYTSLALIIVGCLQITKTSPYTVTQKSPETLSQIALVDYNEMYQFLGRISQPVSLVQKDALQEISAISKSSPGIFRKREYLHFGIDERPGSQFLITESDLQKTYTFQENNFFSVTYFEGILDHDRPNPVVTLIFQTPKDYRENQGQIKEARLVAASFVKTNAALGNARYFTYLPLGSDLDPSKFRLKYEFRNSAGVYVSQTMQMLFTTGPTGFQPSPAEPLVKSDSWDYVQVRIIDP